MKEITEEFLRREYPQAFNDRRPALAITGMTEWRTVGDPNRRWDWEKPNTTN